jgi:hypothetical protein
MLLLMFLMSILMNAYKIFMYDMKVFSAFLIAAGVAKADKPGRVLGPAEQRMG